MPTKDETITKQNEERVMQARDPYVRAAMRKQTEADRWPDKVEKLYFGSLDVPKCTIVAQYNPKEVGLDKSVPWQKGKNSKANTPDLEFTSADGRSLSVERTPCLPGPTLARHTAHLAMSL